jgi:hypothetical protein
MLRDCCVVYVAAKIHGDRQSTTHDASRYARQQRRRTVSLVTHRAPIFPLTGVHLALLRPSRYSKIILPRGWASSNWLRNAAASETTKERWNAAELQRISGELELKSPERIHGERRVFRARAYRRSSAAKNPGNPRRVSARLWRTIAICLPLLRYTAGLRRVRHARSERSRNCSMNCTPNNIMQ